MQLTSYHYGYIVRAANEYYSIVYLWEALVTPETCGKMEEIGHSWPVFHTNWFEMQFGHLCVLKSNCVQNQTQVPDRTAVILFAIKCEKLLDKYTNLWKMTDALTERLNINTLYWHIARFVWKCKCCRHVYQSFCKGFL